MTNKPAPSPNGRSPTGRFARGNRGGPGNPHGGTVARLRSALLATITEADVREIVASLVALAKGGDLTATRLILDRALGSKWIDHLWEKRPRQPPVMPPQPEPDAEPEILSLDELKRRAIARAAELGRLYDAALANPPEGSAP